MTASLLFKRAENFLSAVLSSISSFPCFCLLKHTEGVLPPSKLIAPLRWQTMDVHHGSQYDRIQSQIP